MHFASKTTATEEVEAIVFQTAFVAQHLVLKHVTTSLFLQLLRTSATHPKYYFQPLLKVHGA